MSVNILEIAKGALSGDALDSLSGLLGEDRTKTQSALDGALPAILGGLMQGVSTPEGAREYGQMADDADPGMFSNIAGMVSGNSGALLAIGAPLLLKMFGAKQDGMLATVARLAGIGGGTAGTLMKVVAPLIMSLLGSKKKELSLNTDQFASMMMDQRQHVAAAMPAEVSQSMNFGAFLNELDEPSARDVAPVAANDPVGTAAQSVSNAAQSVSNTAADVPKPGGGMLMKLIPLALIAALGYFGYTQFAGGPDVPDAAQMEATTSGISTLTDTVGGVTSSLSGITDVESAQTAAESITAATGTLEGLNLDSMGEAGKAQVTGMLGGLVGGIESALETAYKIPGVQAVIEPAIGPFLEKLRGL